MDNCLNILSESLDEKIKVLREIESYNTRQEQVFSSQQVHLEDFDEAVEEKGRLIEKLNHLDDGFESLYLRISDVLKEHRQEYAEEIRVLQEKVARVTELSVAIQAQEARNKKLVEDYFRKAKAGIGQNRKSSRAAYDYYKSMSGAAYSQNGVWDSKQ